MVMVVVMVVMVMIMMVMMVVVIMMMIMVMMMAMVIFGNYHRLFIQDGGVGGPFVFGAQNVFGVRNGIQQLGK